MYNPTLTSNEMKLFFGSCTLWNVIIGLNAKYLKVPENNAPALHTLGIIYGSFGFFPNKLKYLLPPAALLKVSVIGKWIQSGCPTDDPLMTIAIGDFAMGVVFSIVFYNLVYSKG